MSFTEEMSQAISVPAASLTPANRANNATAYVVGPVAAKNFRRFMAHVQIGVLTGAANVQAYFQACTASNGTFANVSSTNQTVLLDSSNTEATLEMRADQLADGDDWIQLAVLVSANAAFCSAALYGGESHYKPASQFDVAAATLEQRYVQNTSDITYS